MSIRRVGECTYQMLVCHTISLDSSHIYKSNYLISILSVLNNSHYFSGNVHYLKKQ